MPKQLQEFAHPDYLALADDFVTLRDCFNGSRAIKAAGVRYLPALSGQTPGDYEAYKCRALFFPITGKTTNTLVGFVTSKNPELEYDDQMKPYFTDGQGSFQFSEVYIRLLQEILLMGRYGILIDAPVTGAQRPTMAYYTAENIVNWDVNADGSINWVLLREEILVPKQNSRFGRDSKIQYRLCMLNSNNQYTVELLDDNLATVSNITPLFAGRPLNYVPFTCIGATGVHMGMDKPPMLDIATINISHYMTSADLEWGRHFVGLPTPVITGVDASTSLKIGGTAAWVLPNEGADAKYLEFLGQGLGSLENALKEKISLMASMSARLVDSSTKGSEAAETVKLRYMSETASLKQIAISAEAGLNTVYGTIAQMVQSEKPTIEIPKDFLNTQLEAGVLRELFNAYFKGALTKESLIFNLKRAELLDPTRDEEEEAAAMLTPQQIAALEKPATTQGNQQ